MASLEGAARQLVARAGGQAGSANGQGSSSASALLSALIPAALVSVAMFLVFLFARSRFRRIYQTRTYLGRFRKTEQTPTPSQTLFGWVADFRKLPDDYILNHQSIDGYLYLRFIKICGLICLFGALITWPILFPVNATAPTPAVPQGTSPPSQFDLISFSNSTSSPNRYYAHAILAWIFFGAVVFVVGRESLLCVHLQQAYLRAPQTASRISTRTVLFTDVPEDLMDEAKLRGIFPHVKHVWMATDTKELEDLVKERDKTVKKLEGAEISLSKAANGQRLKMLKKNKPFENPIKWADDNKRPTHKLKFLIGQKVDTIDWCRGHLCTLIPKVEKLQAEHWNGQAKFISACFIEFETIQAAESAYQKLARETKLEARASFMRPDEVIWANLSKKKATRKILHYAAVAVVTLMILFWTPFTAFVGALTNINYLTTKVPFLSFINDIPKVILGVVTGLLPVILLNLLMAIVPIFLRLISKKSGQVTVGAVEMEVHTWYFVFQVIIVFIVTTLASGASSVVSQIVSDPSSALTLLAQSLPKASNFYNSYVLATAVGAIGGMFLNIGGLAVFIILKSLLMKTPRKRFNQYVSVGGLGWGSTYPKSEIFIIIALAYAIIAPLVLGFTAIGLFLFYIAYRYMLMYVIDTARLGTMGRNYARSMQHIMVGVYIAMVCLVGLLIIETANQTPAAGPLVIVVLLLAAIIVAHVLINRTVASLTNNLTGHLDDSRSGAVESQLENGDAENGTNGHGAKETVQSPTISTPSHGGATDLKSNHETVLATSQNQSGMKGMVFRLIRPKKMPPFVDHFADPTPEYSADVRREAYLDPAITTPTPLLWLVHDDMGISAREKELSGKVLGTTDQAAYWEAKKGGLVTIWEGQPIEKQNELVTEAPIYEEKPRY